MSRLFLLLVAAYQRLFCRRRLYRWNQLLFQLSLRGLGVLNYESDRVSGERELIRRVGTLGGAGTVLDVGAHEGSYATEAARALHEAEVFAFEPHPDTFRRLEAGAARGRYVPVHAALSDRPGTATLYDHGAATGSQHASMVRDAFTTFYKNPDVRSWTVPATTLDAFIRQRAIARVRLLKIDTEGTELDVLRGAQEAIAAGLIDVVQVELNFMNALRRVFLRDFREVLPGYAAYRLLPDGPVLLDGGDAIFEEIFAFQNVLFVSGRLPPDAVKALTA